MAKATQKRAYYSRMLGPSWRWDIAKGLAATDSISAPQRFDPTVIAAAAYLTLQRSSIAGCRAAAADYPLVAAAEALHNNLPQTGPLKIMVLGGMSREEISRRVGLDSGLLALWEELFFDVRDRRHAASWVYATVIVPEQDAGRVQLACQLKFAASGGEVAVRCLLDVQEQIPLAEAERLFARQLKLDLKVDEAVALPLESERSRLQLMKMSLEMQLETKRLELANEKLKEKCRASLRSHELALARINLKRARMEKQAVVDRQKAEERGRRAEAKQGEQARLRKFQLEMWAKLKDAERQAAETRAAASPLAKLRWEDPLPQMADAPQVERCVPQLDSVTISINNTFAFQAGQVSAAEEDLDLDCAETCFGDHCEDDQVLSTCGANA